MFLVDTPLTPDGPTARKWVQKELSKPEYQQHKSLWERLSDWLQQHLPQPTVGGVTIPWYVFAGLLLLGLLIIAVYSARRFRRSPRVSQGSATGAGAVFGSESPLDAGSYREEAERLVDADPAAAVLAAYRAVVLHAGDRGLLSLTAATTVGDVDRALCPSLPAYVNDIRSAGSNFATVRYGGLPATPDEVHAILCLDDVVAFKGTQGTKGAGSTQGTGGTA